MDHGQHTTPTDPATVALKFNDSITAGDPDALTDLMTDDHRFVDTEGRTVVGRDACRDAWAGFFASFPGYRNVFTSTVTDDQEVRMRGYSICTEPQLAGPALWAATVTDGRIALWQVYQDTPANRLLLGLAGTFDA